MLVVIMKVKRSELSNFKMVSGNENKYSIIIDSDIVKEWVGIGWIELRNATKEDYKKYLQTEDQK